MKRNYISRLSCSFILACSLAGCTTSPAPQSCTGIKDWTKDAQQEIKREKNSAPQHAALDEVLIDYHRMRCDIKPALCE